MSKYPKSEGALFANKKTTDKQPDMRGKVVITREQMQMLVEMGKAGIEPTLQLAAWKREAKSNGQSYLYISAEAYMKEEEAPASNGFDDIPF